MADRKAEKERLRQARIEAEKRERAAQRRKLILGYAVAGALTLLVLVGIVYVIAQSGGDEASKGAHVFAESGEPNGLEPDERSGPAPPEQREFDIREAAQKAGCTLREDLPDQGSAHVEEGAAPAYETNPPTSGNHNQIPQADGAFLEAADPYDYLHSLEHGRIAIQYSPDLPEDQQLELRGLYEELYSGALLFPNPDMPYRVAAVAWQNFLGCEEYRGPATLDAIRAFGLEKFNEAPEDAGFLPSPTPVTPGEETPGS